MYRPLRPHPKTPSVVREFIERHVDQQFGDVHVMLRLPMESRGLRHGCNFAAAHVLLSITSGLSVLFYDAKSLYCRGNRTTLFKKVLQQHYPWREEGRVSKADRHAATTALWDLYRNPFAHALGVIADPEVTHVKIDKDVLSERLIEELEVSDARPSWLQQTLRQEWGKFVLDVRPLYWGVRQTLQRLTSDGARMSRLADQLSRLPDGLIPASSSYRTTSGPIREMSATATSTFVMPGKKADQ